MQARFDKLRLVLPGWLAFMLYSPSLTHGLVWDDIYFLVDTPYLRDPALWWDAVRQPLFVSVNYFRPLPLLSFVAETRLAGVTPFVFHLSNLLLHALNTTLVVLLAAAVLGNAKPWLPVLAGVLSATHPALVESVCWISDRFDLMMAFFLLSALLAERRVSHAGWRTASIALLFFAALLCKETAVVFLALLPAWRLLRMKHQETWLVALQRLVGKEMVWMWLALMASLVLYLLLRYVSLGYLYLSDAQMSPGAGLQHLLLIGKTLGWYLLLAVWPFGQVGPVHPAVTPLTLSDGLAWLGLAVVLLLLVCLSFCLRARILLRPVLMALMAILALAPVANLVPLTIGDNLLHDRYLMLPLAFAAIGLVSGLQSLKFSWHIAVPVAAWCMASILTVTMLIPHWENNVSLWAWAYERSPDSSLGRQNYVAALVNADRNEEVVRLARTMLQQGPQSINVTHNLALAEARLGHFEAAEQSVLKVIEMSPESDTFTRFGRSEALNLLAFIRMSQGQYATAEAPLREAIALMPHFARPHYNLALVLYELADWENGDQELALAVRYGPADLSTKIASFGAERRQKAQEAWAGSVK